MEILSTQTVFNIKRNNLNVIDDQTLNTICRCSTSDGAHKTLER